MTRFWGLLGGDLVKAELKINSVNQIIKDTDIYVKGDGISSISLVVKGRIRISAEGVNIIVGSGNFLGLCDLPSGAYKVTYTADSNAVIYTFPSMHFNQAVRGLIKANKDYAALMFSTLSKYIRELSKIYDAMGEMEGKTYDFIKSANEKYLELARQSGVRVNEIDSINNLTASEDNRKVNVDVDKVMYYKACCDIPTDAQKAFLNTNMIIPVYHIIEQVGIINLLIEQCAEDAEYLRSVANPLIKDSRSLYTGVLQLATALQRMNTDASAAVSLFDDVIDNVNSLEKLLYDKCNIDLEIDHDYMEESYFKLINGDSHNSAGESDEIALTEDNFVDLSELDGALEFILEYSGIESDTAEQFRGFINEFEQLSDKMSTEDKARGIRRGIIKIFYDLYKRVFLKDYNSTEETPVVIDLFLKYGFISEKLLTDEIMEELLSLDDYSSGMESCKVYSMKEWLTEVYEGKKEPSKSEFDMDYFENLRDMRKTGRITTEQEQKLLRDNSAKFDYEVQNLFKTNHRLIYGQVSVFVPFLYTEGCSGSVQRCFLSKDKINAAVHRLLQIDYSAFYRESLFTGQNEGIKKEYIMEEVFPDFIVFPAFGSNGIMWQELSGRRRNSKGRFLVPAFMDTDIDTAMIKLFGRFRWELCRTMQGASWNNIQIKSLTSEYSDFIQFYRKNRELSEDKKDKLKLQIQKCRNNTREVFVIDYENWIKHEANGGLCLSKPVREILATYCPFSKEMREKVSEQPLFRDAMARFTRERGKKLKEYDLKFRIWDKDKVEVPQQIVDTRDFYLNK